MAYRKKPSQLLVRINVQLTVEQIEYIDGLSTASRAAVIRKIIADHMAWERRHKEAYSRNVESEEYQEVEYATPFDLEITFDAYRKDFSEALLNSFQNGRQVGHLVVPFNGCLQKYLQKTAHDTQIEVFLREKMMEVGSCECYE